MDRTGRRVEPAFLDDPTLTVTLRQVRESLDWHASMESQEQSMKPQAKAPAKGRRENIATA